MIMRNKNPIKKTIDNARDATKEALHRSTAEAEHARRKALGDEMTPGERLESVANELKNRAQAEADEIKQKTRGR
jgi:hypothetical protein